MIKASVAENIVTFTINVSNRPMNVISEDFLNSYEKIVADYYLSDNTFKGFIFTSDRPEFVVGAILIL